MKYTDPDGRYSWNQFKTEVKEGWKDATNLDFGKDYMNYAQYSWDNGNYLFWGLYELDATCELLYDGILAYEGSKVLDLTIKGTSMLIGTIASLNPSSTVVLGKYNSGACGGYTKMASQIGGKCFQIPQGLYKILDKLGIGEKLNFAWLNGVINSGARILLNSDPNAALETNSAYGMEMRTLKEAGYKFIETIEKGICCWEAIRE